MTDLHDIIMWHTRRAAVAGRLETIAWYITSAYPTEGPADLIAVPTAS